MDSNRIVDNSFNISTFSSLIEFEIFSMIRRLVDLKFSVSLGTLLLTLRPAASIDLYSSSLTSPVLCPSHLLHSQSALSGSSFKTCNTLLQQKPNMSLDLLSLDASTIQRLFEEGKTNSVQLVTQVLDQIEKQNQAGLKLGAIISVAPRELLLETAAQLDKERQAGKHRGRLHGIPIIVKDSINTHPNLGMKTTAGSWALENSKPARSATVIEKLISKGIIILGKANLTELCNWKGDNTTMGWSAYGGQTTSAYVEGPMRRDQGHGGPTVCLIRYRRALSRYHVNLTVLRLQVALLRGRRSAFLRDSVLFPLVARPTARLCNRHLERPYSP
ncbi:hypothetical protein TWF718_003760 [Orbilia javanica]|uniref:Amidase domain-containing protein n=1 Tax=Orbilia javanica TaxID=47235 RepID=A0AAN8NYS8_9PEZI